MRSSRPSAPATLDAGGSFQYTPPAGFVAEDVFTYRASDGLVFSNTATVTIDVSDTPGVTVYVSYTEFIAAVDALGLVRIREGFEDDVAWGHVRTTIVDGEMTAPEVTNLGLTWRANSPDSEVTTPDGPALIGNWGFFTLPHGSSDGHRLRCARQLRRRLAGNERRASIRAGRMDRDQHGARKIGLFLGPGLDSPVDLGETCDPVEPAPVLRRDRRGRRNGVRVPRVRRQERGREVQLCR